MHARRVRGGTTAPGRAVAGRSASGATSPPLPVGARGGAGARSAGRLTPPAGATRSRAVLSSAIGHSPEGSPARRSPAPSLAPRGGVSRRVLPRPGRDRGAGRLGGGATMPTAGRGRRARQVAGKLGRRGEGRRGVLPRASRCAACGKVSRSAAHLLSSGNRTQRGGAIRPALPKEGAGFV